MSDYRTGSCNNCGSTPRSGYLQEYKCSSCSRTFCSNCSTSAGCPHCNSSSYTKWYCIQN